MVHKAWKKKFTNEELDYFLEKGESSWPQNSAKKMEKFHRQLAKRKCAKMNMFTTVLKY